MQILGVDFSGAQTDRNTWLARGSLRGNTLSFDSCRPVKRAKLTDELAKCAGPTVAALDFPFSVPREFARFWQGQHPPIFETPIFETMPDLWAAAAGMDWNDFSALRDAFVARYGELKRSCDPPESYSCLHRVNPNMVPMTFRGMQMLHRLWAGNTANPMSAPPLPDRSRPDRSRPDRSRPDRPIPARPIPARPIPARPIPARPIPARPIPARPIPARPIPARPIPARPIPARPIPARLGTGHRAAGGDAGRGAAPHGAALQGLQERGAGAGIAPPNTGRPTRKGDAGVSKPGRDAGAMPGAPRRAGRSGRRHRRRPLGHRPVPFPRSADEGSPRLRTGSVTGRLALCARELRKWASFDFPYRTADGEPVEPRTCPSTNSG